MMPPTVVEIREHLCAGHGCKANPEDPCAACENGHWGRYKSTGCAQAWPIFNPAPSIVLDPFRPKPGDLLRLLIKKITGRDAPTCGACGSRVRQMNEWGWLGCLRRRDIIIGWLVEQAMMMGHRIERKSVVSLIRVALKESRKSLTPPPASRQ